MINSLRLVMLAIIVLGISSCGLKGPLYNPPVEKTATTHQPTPGQTTPSTHVVGNGQATSRMQQP